MKAMKRFGALLIAAVPVAMLAMPMAPAGAGTASPAFVAISGVGAAKVPNTTISGKPAKYTPATLTVSAEAAGKTCTSANATFTITNQTTTSAQVTLNGSAFGSPIPPKHGLIVCAPEGVAGTTAVFGVSGSKSAKLTVHAAP